MIVADFAGNDWFYGLLINSQVHPYIESRPYLHPCMVEIRLSTHPFLSYDSWINCTVLHCLKKTELTEGNWVGVLTPQTIQNVKQGILECPRMDRFYKKKFEL